MAFFPSLQILLILSFIYIPSCVPFTVVMSDSGVPSALVDGPQTGFSMSQNGARTDIHEQKAVYDIMRATGNDWATDIPDVCRGRWHGIECMPDKDNVYHVVTLSFGALSDDTAFPTCDSTRSYISPSITKLPHLRTLFFYRCFSYNPQPIPSFLGQLGPTLQTLVLRENGNVGLIPNELGNLTRLRVLDLHKNNLNGSIPVSLGRITGLRSLDLSDNRLTGSIPSLTFPLLKILNLNQNHLNGPIPTTIGMCYSLIKIDFSRNRLSGPIPDSINGLKSLILLDFSYNSLSGPIPESLTRLRSLRVLRLDGNYLNGCSLEVVCPCGVRNLILLILMDLKFTGPDPNQNGSLSKRRQLIFDIFHFAGLNPRSIHEVEGRNGIRINKNMLLQRTKFFRNLLNREGFKGRLKKISFYCYNHIIVIQICIAGKKWRRYFFIYFCDPCIG
ncbi:hypothetical protein LguiB_008214 [Lonicera macranthoides]